MVTLGPWLIYCSVLLGACGGAEAAPPCPDRVRIATWNLEWLHRQSDRGVVKRTDADYARLRRYADRLNADVVAIQEVDGAEAARRVFDPARFDVHVTSQRDPQRTGFAVRRGLRVTRHPDVETLAAGGLRAGADVTVDVCGTSIRLLSVHLKSGCWADDLARPTKACRKLAAQVAPLEAWIDARAAERVPFAVLGDFNRRFEPPDAFWPAIDDGDPPNADLTAVTRGRRSPCWGGVHPELIDHVVLDRLAAGWVRRDSFSVHVYDAADRPFKKTLSDHCPVSVDLTPR